MAPAPALGRPGAPGAFALARVSALAPGALIARLRGLLAKQLAAAILIGLGALAVVASLPAITALASNLGSSSSSTASSSATTYGPPTELRSAVSQGSAWAEAPGMSQPVAHDLVTALVALDGPRRWQEVRTALETLNQQRIEREAAAAAEAQASEARAAAAVAPAEPHTLSVASGFAPGTVIAGAHITIYGCEGSGGGFCGGMTGGGNGFAGAAACSYNLPLGTRLTIAGDPTGRVYECMDRGALSNTWVDVFFYNTEDGFAWASQLGSTQAAITIVN